MEIRKNYRGEFIPDTNSIFYPFYNKYIPLYVRDVYELIAELPKNYKHAYHLPDFYFYSSARTTAIKKIIYAFEYSVMPFRFTINECVYFIMKGVIFNENKVPLIMLGIQEKEWMNDRLEEDKTYEKYVLFYSTTFMTNPSLMAFNRRLQKAILLPCFTKGIEVRLVDPTTIEKNTFARILEKPFSSISEMTHHLRHTLPLFLKDTGEDTLSLEDVAIGVEEAEEFQVLSIEEEATMLGYIEEISNESSGVIELGGQNDSIMTGTDSANDYLIGIDPYDGEPTSVSFVNSSGEQYFSRDRSIDNILSVENLTPFEIVERYGIAISNDEAEIAQVLAVPLPRVVLPPPIITLIDDVE